jgi:hypothetical protein
VCVCVWTYQPPGCQRRKKGRKEGRKEGKVRGGGEISTDDPIVKIKDGRADPATAPLLSSIGVGMEQE